MKKTIKSRVFYTDANDIIILELQQTKQGLRTFLELEEGKFELDPEYIILEMFIAQMNEEQIYLGEL